MDFNDIFKNELQAGDVRAKSESLKSMSDELYNVYQSLVKAGFSESQAMQLLINMIVASLKS